MMTNLARVRDAANRVPALGVSATPVDKWIVDVIPFGQKSVRFTRQQLIALGEYAAALEAAEAPQ